MTNLKEVALAAMLTIGAQEAAAQNPILGHDHDNDDRAQSYHKAEFQMPVVRGGKNFIPVDCDALDKNGQITPDFVKAMGVESHFSRTDYLIKMEESRTGVKVSDEDRMQRYLDHLQSHNHARDLTLERIEVGAKHCRDKYLEPE